MRRATVKWLRVMAMVLACVALARAAQEPAEKYFGTWSGTWDAGDRSGGFDLTLEKGKGSAVGGSVSVTGDPTYKAALKTVTFDGPKMNATYDFPPDESAEVVLAATFDDKSAKGTWSLRVKASGNEVASGTWAIARK